MAKKDEKQGVPQPHLVASLDELRPYMAKLSIQVIGADGALQEMVVPVRTIPYLEYVDIGNQVPDASPPISGVDKFNRPIYNANDPTYIAAQSSVQMERNYRRLHRMLALPIPGETEEEQLNYLRSLDTGMIRQLFIGIRALAEIGDASIQQQADSFQPGGTGRTVDTGEAANPE